jgi:hypothetical protein
MKQSIAPHEVAQIGRLVAAIDTDGLHGNHAQLESVLAALPPYAIFEVEKLTRDIDCGAGSAWHFAQTNKQTEKFDPAFATVSMFNSNGRIREAALQSLNQLPDSPFFVAALVARMNDWAEPVRPESC